MTRYIDKKTGELWKCCGFCTNGDERYYHMYVYNDLKNKGKDAIRHDMTAAEIEDRFDEKPFEKPSIKILDVKQKHPVKIILHCPECGAELKTKGGAICTSPLQYEHKCSNPDCTYERCTASYYSGMLAAVTDEQEEKIKDGTYNENVDGEIIRLNEKDLWDFKR